MVLNPRRLLVDARKYLQAELTQIAVCKPLLFDKPKEPTKAEKELQQLVKDIDDYLAGENP